MAVFRIEKTRDYTVMSNHHLRDKSLSLKAKGLLSLMLSLPEEWDYTTKGLARICKDGVDSTAPSSTPSWSSPDRRNQNRKNLNGKIQSWIILNRLPLSWENLNRKTPHN